jgi:hypothetical protein
MAVKAFSEVFHHLTFVPSCLLPLIGPGISCYPLADGQLTELEALIIGPDDSPFAGGTLLGRSGETTLFMLLISWYSNVPVMALCFFTRSSSCCVLRAAAIYDAGLRRHFSLVSVDSQ